MLDTTLRNFRLAGVALDAERKQRFVRLVNRLAGYNRVLIAFSGGVDSAFLAIAAADVLGDNALAVTALSPSLPPADKTDADALIKKFNFRHRYIETDEFADPEYLKNPPTRCAICKRTLTRALQNVAAAEGIDSIAFGATVDDATDYRPGEAVALELGAVFPLRDALLSKADIRAALKALDVSIWNKPASACLSSRVPYGSPLSIEIMERIAAAETAVRALGFRVSRVRHHGDVARIEVGSDELERMSGSIAKQASAELKRIGYRYVALDLDGYRTGSLNESLNG